MPKNSPTDRLVAVYTHVDCLAVNAFTKLGVSARRQVRELIEKLRGGRSRRGRVVRDERL